MMAIKKYYIEDNKGSFWCEDDGGYWSNEEHPEWSIKHRFSGNILWVLPLFVMMRLFIRDYKVKILEDIANKKVRDC